jgi:arylsulfatase
MECFAGFLSHTDDEIGRVLAFLADLGELDNTVLVLVSDNGASAEGGRDGSINDIRMQNIDPASPAELARRIDEIGGPLTHNNYPWGWTMAGNTPFRRWKREVHEGGVADPCIVSWPGRLSGAGGGIRHQFAHAIDVAPTILELIGIEPPAEIDGIHQTELDGTSFAYLLEEGADAAPGRHRTQYFEMFGSRAIYHDGWKAVTYHPVGPVYGDGLDPNAPFEDDRWELYHVAEDVSETHDRAGDEPDRLGELVDLWWVEAGRNQVLPLDNRVLWALLHPKPSRRAGRDRARYFPGGAQVPESAAVSVRNRSHRLAVTLELPAGGPPDGVLLAQGLALGGWSLHFRAGRLCYVHNLYGKERHVVEATAPVTDPSGRHTAEMAFEKDPDGPGGTAVLRWDGSEVGGGGIPIFTPSRFNGVGVGLTCGYEWGPPIGDGYRAPFPFNGVILEAVVEATGPVLRDPLAELEAILSEQ